MRHAALAFVLVMWVLWMRDAPDESRGWLRFAVYGTEEDCEAGMQRFIGLGRTERFRCLRESYPSLRDLLRTPRFPADRDPLPDLRTST